MPRATVKAGPRCRHCELEIERLKSGALAGQYVHTATRNVFCTNGLTGLTARFAEPR
jgi:hypothetical protein